MSQRVLGFEFVAVKVEELALKRVLRSTKTAQLECMLYERGSATAQ